MRKLLLALLSLSLVGCIDSKEEILEEKNQGLVYCAEANPVSFNPQVTTTGSTIDIIANQLYDRLISIDPVTAEFKSELASDWKLAKTVSLSHLLCAKGLNFIPPHILLQHANLTLMTSFSLSVVYLMYTTPITLSVMRITPTFKVWVLTNLFVKLSGSLITKFGLNYLTQKAVF